MEQQYELLSLDHVPFQPPRKGTPGEGIFLSLWRDYLAADRNRLSAILRTVGVPTQRDASICASFMTFMGCNGGHCFTLEALRLTEKLGGPYRGFMAAWALENNRSTGVNHGLRSIEYMLAEQHPIDHGRFNSGSVNWGLVPDVTMRDTDVVEAMVEWWSGGDAGIIREIAEPLIKAANQKAWSDLFAKREATHPTKEPTK
jgi:hypothetical protein